MIRFNKMTVQHTYILGIASFYHDSSATLIKNGEIIAAAQEERFTRRKNDPTFPINSINYCLKEAHIDISDINIIAFYDKPFLKFERILSSYLTFAPKGLKSFIKAMPQWIKQKIFLKDYIRKSLKFSGKIIFPEHHHSHAASAFYPSPFKEAAILTIDGVGEWATTTFGKGKNNSIELLYDIHFPHSLGLLYSAFTYYCGFKVNSGEYKLMGLAPYGKPKYVELILKHLIDLKDDGSFKLDMKYFDYCVGLTMMNKNFHKLFGGLPFKSEAPITQKQMDLAQSIQTVTEMAIMKMVKHVYKITNCKNLCLAGGVALNCVANGKILREGPFENLWIQPAASDAGGSIGSALIAWFEYLENKRSVISNKDSLKGCYLGPSFSKDNIETYLKKKKIRYETIPENEIPERTADLIAKQKVIGWFQGKMEFGPRALGSRSILADARSEKMQKTLNLKIKFRESFRPFAPSILLEKSEEYFGLKQESPYMLLVSKIPEPKRTKLEENLKAQGLTKLNITRSSTPAITHVDYSARIQTVNQNDNPLYYQMIKQFYIKYGCPIIINTSFNVRGEPIVCTPKDAFRCFMRTNMDYLMIESFLIDKKKQDIKLFDEIKIKFELD